MQPKRRLQILATVGHRNRLPHGTNAAEVQELDGLLAKISASAWSYELTRAGWAAIERLGQSVLTRQEAAR